MYRYRLLAVHCSAVATHLSFLAFSYISRVASSTLFFCLVSQEKMARITEAFLFSVANTSKALYGSLASAVQGDGEKDNKTDK